MRPLNRPMFKYGGPIKEGIMTGMKDNVDTPKRGRVDGPGSYAGFLIPAAMTAGRFLLRPLVRYGANVLRRAPTTGRGGQRLLPKPGEGPYSPVKSVFDPNVAVPTKLGSYLLRSPEGRLITGGAGFAGKVGKKAIGAAKYAASSPLTLGSIVYYGGGALLPDGTPDPNDPKNIKQPGQGRQFTGDEAMVGDPRQPLPDTPSQSKVEQITKDRIQKNKERYYRLMGLDNMKKDAIYDSLLDASNIVRQEGADLKGSIKSGSLQNQIINAISKNLDKSAAIKRQIDAAVLKGEIEKDIKASDPTAQKRAELTDKQIALADKQLSGGSLIEKIQAGAKAQGNVNSTANVYNSILETYQIEPEVLADTAETLKFRKADNYTTDTALVKSLVEAQGKGAGIYIIDKTAVLIDDKGNASTLFQG